MNVEKLLSKHKDNINIIKGNSNKVLKEISLEFCFFRLAISMKLY